MTATKRDWTKTGTIVALADWIRRDGGALAVLVMREGDGALSVADGIPARDVEAMMLAHLEPLLEDLQRARAEERKQGARVKWDEMGR